MEAKKIVLKKFVCFFCLNQGKCYFFRYFFISDLFSRRFREVPELPLSKLCAVPFALQNRALFEEEKRAKMCRETGRTRAKDPAAGGLQNIHTPPP